MKRALLIFLCLTFILASLGGCMQKNNEYKPTGEFYMKTSPSRGDGGVCEVISLEAESKTYTGEIVTFTVGLGHLPGAGGYGDEVKDTFCVDYKVIEAPWEAEKVAEWEKTVEYTDSWYDEKYDSTEQVNRPFLIFPHYGEFYPIYTEEVSVVFPSDVEKGYFTVEIHIMIDGEREYGIFSLRFYFERVDGVLNLDPHGEI